MTAAAQPVVQLHLEDIERSTDLHALTQIVHRGRATFTEVATAVWRIKTAKLYKQTHSSWESWCQDNWYTTRRHADRQIKALEVAKDLQERTGQKILPSHAAELESVDPQLRSAVIEEAGEAGRLTAEAIRDVVDGGTVKPAPKSVQDRRTPRWLFDVLNERFGPFVLDAYASHENALCENHYTVVDNGHEKPWLDVTFANPEFKQMTAAVQKAFEEGLRGRRSCVLGPAAGSQEWFHEVAVLGTIWHPDCRINYDDPDGKPTGSRASEGGADRDTTIITFGPGHWNEVYTDVKGNPTLGFGDNERVFQVFSLSVAEFRP